MGGYPKLMVHTEKSCLNWWFRSTLILGNFHICVLYQLVPQDPSCNSLLIQSTSRPIYRNNKIWLCLTPRFGVPFFSDKPTWLWLKHTAGTDLAHCSLKLFWVFHHQFFRAGRHLAASQLTTMLFNPWSHHIHVIIYMSSYTCHHIHVINLVPLFEAEAVTPDWQVAHHRWYWEPGDAQREHNVRAGRLVHFLSCRAGGTRGWRSTIVDIVIYCT